MPITAGQLHTLLEIVRRREKKTPGGGVDASWSVAGELWASVEPFTGTERLRAEQITATITHRIIARAEPAVSPKDKLRDRDGTEYDIRAVLKDQYGRSVEILAAQKVTA